MVTILDFVQVGICVGLVFLILMHSGKDSGLSGAFGVGTGAGPLGGGSLVERNLNRWTVGFADRVRGQHDHPDQDLLSPGGGVARVLAPPGGSGCRGQLRLGKE